MNLESRNGTLSDGLGRFQLNIPDSGTVLRISHVGYHPILHRITKEMIESSDSRSFQLTVRLQQQSTLLSAVNVMPNENTVLAQKGTILFDFSFVQGKTLLLMAQDGERKLSLRADLGKSLVEIPVGKKGDQLYEDCLGNIHLFGKDSVYQIFIDSTGIQLAHAFARGYFISQMGDCSTSSDSHIFFSSFQKAGQEVSHYGLNRTTKEGVLLRQVYDHETIQEIESYFNEMKMNPFGRSRRAGSSFSNECVVNDAFSFRCNSGFGRIDDGNILQIGRGTPASWGASFSGFRGDMNSGRRMQAQFAGMTLSEFYDRTPTRSFELEQSMDGIIKPSPYARLWMNMLQRPTYSPMFSVRDSIYVFDHVLGICDVYTTDGNAVRTFPIVHQEMGEWRNKLVADANGVKLYARMMRGSSVYLAEIDLDNGGILSSSRLREAALAEELKVKDGHAYYVVQDADIMVPDRLVRQRL